MRLQSRMGGAQRFFDRRHDLRVGSKIALQCSTRGNLLLQSESIKNTPRCVVIRVLAARDLVVLP